MYDRPAEIFAFDPVEGARTLRVFHSTRSVARPPIRLSYYGGGHYDSVVGAEWEANLLREAPGLVEARRIAISRAGGGAESAVRSGSGSDDALAAALTASREQFDEATENIDAALLALEMASSAADAGLHTSQPLEPRVGGQSSGAGSSTLEAQILQQVLRSSALEDDSSAVQALIMEQTRAAADEEALVAAVQASLVDSERTTVPADGVIGASSTAPSNGGTGTTGHRGDDPELRAAVEMSLSSTARPGDLDAMYNMCLDLTEDQQLARLLELSRQEDAQRMRRTLLAQEDMRQRLQQHGQQQPPPSTVSSHPDNVAELTQAPVAQPTAIESSDVHDQHRMIQASAEEDEDALLEAAILASLAPPH